MSDRTPTARYRIVWLGYVGSDWLAIYRDRAKVYEGHPPSLDDALDLLGCAYDESTASAKMLTDQRRRRGFPEVWE